MLNRNYKNINFLGISNPGQKTSQKELKTPGELPQFHGIQQLVDLKQPLTCEQIFKKMAAHKWSEPRALKHTTGVKNKKETTEISVKLNTSKTQVLVKPPNVNAFFYTDERYSTIIVRVEQLWGERPNENLLDDLEEAIGIFKN
ncbi:MAG: hypothetical protein WCG84_03460 [Candidatus Moraniibacteriota bacterium]